MEKQQKSSLLDMVQGGVKERVAIEFNKVIDNILNKNADAKKKRTITLKIEFTPDAERQTIGVNYIADSKLVPLNPITTSLYIAADENGEVGAVEMVPQIPGQQDFNGNVQPEGKVVPITTKQALSL